MSDVSEKPSLPSGAAGPAAPSVSSVPGGAAAAHAGHGHPAPEGGGHGRVGPLALAALGVVFGDIGTSPLYTFKECMNGEHPLAQTSGNILGVCSLIVWSLTLVVTVKYMLFIMKADNHGEGGILALLALIPDRLRKSGPHIGWLGHSEADPRTRFYYASAVTSPMERQSSETKGKLK